MAVSKRNIILFTTLGLVTLASFVLNLILGSVMIPVNDIGHILTGSQANDEMFRTIILKLRLPSAIAAIGAGAALSVAGLSMQTLFRNPLADPSILGISSGASLGVALVTLITGQNIIGLFARNVTILSAAFIGAMIVLVIIALLSQRVNATTLLLIGVMLSFSVSAITGILQFFALKEGLQSFVIWGMGSFKNITTSQSLLTLVMTFLLVAGIFFQSKGLNVFVIGETYAINSGIKIRRLTTIIVILSGSLVAVITAFCGPIAFIGLMVPHLARMLFRTFNHRILIPASVCIGMALALLCNVIASFPGFESTLPINAITSIIGAPIVIFLILKK